MIIKNISSIISMTPKALIISKGVGKASKSRLVPEIDSPISMYDGKTIKLLMSKFLMVLGFTYFQLGFSHGHRASF